MTFPANSRRNFLKTITTTAIVAPASFSVFSDIGLSKNERNFPGGKGSAAGQNDIPIHRDGPSSPLFEPVILQGNMDLSGIDSSLVSGTMAEAVKSAPSGNTTSWGIPFNIGKRIIYLKDKQLRVDIDPVSAGWMIFLHTSDHPDPRITGDGFYGKPFRGNGLLNEEAAGYIAIYEDGEEISLPVRQRYQIGMFSEIWGENSLESVAHHKPVRVSLTAPMINWRWGWVQTRVSSEDRGDWINWLWAWENPRPEKKISGFRFEPSGKTPIIISAITAGNVKSNPLRWNPRKKAVLSIPEGLGSSPLQEDNGELSNIKLDLGEVISVSPVLIYPGEEWGETYNNKAPGLSETDFIIEYTAHPEAMFNLQGLRPIPVSDLETGNGGIFREVKPSDREVTVKVTEKGSGKLVPVKFHAHGESGEYLAPVNRHRYPNSSWFQDYSVDFVNERNHFCTYIPGETVIKLPQGKVYIEISKGFEIAPVRKVIEITGETEDITVEITKALFWREKGWVSADTHVHFLSPSTAMMEGSAEGVNIINLLASQWGELMTNVGDFDGKTTHGSPASGGDGEYMVRVGTENRQHVMGHISLLGYEGNMILPMTTGGPDESALGDPVEILLTEWAMQCKKQNGLVILPHFPNPRLENAATILSGNADGVEMTSWGNLYGGIDPYSLTDWYRYLNCGYFVAAVGGTDKMEATTAVGAVRTYAKIEENKEFTYDTWKEAVRRGHTFVTYGPLVEFSVEGRPAGSRINMPSGGGTVSVTWEVASVTVPMTRVDLVINGEVRESVIVSDWDGKGNFSVKIPESCWIALLVRGKYPDKKEIITAHTSPVMIAVNNSTLLVEQDALTILEQVEGAIAYLDILGTRADTNAFKRMKMVLTSAHRTIHNQMHAMGYFHQHTAFNDHPEHH